MRPEPAEIEQLPRLAAWLEGQYNLRARHPEREAIYADYTTRSERVRNALPWQCLRYAAPERCTIDWFPAQGRAAGAAPLLVFLHGGFWRGGEKRVFSFLAEPFVVAGVAVALIGYELAPQVSLTRIVEQVADAVAWLAGQAARLGFDPNAITLSGHSAGGHLSAQLSTLPRERFGGAAFRGILPISGIFQLAPMLLTSINHEARISAAEATVLSPALKTRFFGQRYWIVAGASETEDFITQSRDFGEVLRRAGVSNEVTLVPGRHHFDVLQELASPTSPVFKAALRMVTLPRAG